MSSSTDDTSPMTSFSQLYTVLHRYTVIRCYILLEPVPSTSDDSTIKVPLSHRISREFPIRSANSPGDVMVLCYSPPSPPVLTSQRRSAEGATLSKVASPKYQA
ncbi:hypothetical protein FGIG_02810 [Fasciola gigantica]|uniref:Uncharacterized protein n=1 Tax=Fasciola gigantica TaxID=46835 RepID=A0A504YE69_FASGI|nr:hypothetical protein FGIG_02810 [Fasciola gigantica]